MGGQAANEIPLLPLNETIVEVFSDCPANLLECASNYIQETHRNGAEGICHDQGLTRLRSFSPEWVGTYATGGNAQSCHIVPEPLLVVLVFSS